jgi:hypothetical protein
MPVAGAPGAPGAPSMLLALVFPVAVAAVVLPARIVIENPVDFADGLPLLIRPVVATTGFVLVAATLVLAGRAGRGRPLLERTSAIALALGVAMLVSDALVPLIFDAPLGLRNTVQVVGPGAVRGALDAALWCLAGAVAAWRPRRMLSRPWITFAVAFLVVAVGGAIRDCAASACRQSASRLREAVTELTTRDVAGRLPAATPAAVSSGTGRATDTYHVVLDGFNGAYLRDAMRLAGLTPADLPGFVEYPFTRSQYDSTEFSTPGFLTGSTYFEGSLREWLRSFNYRGLFHTIRARLGAPVHVYGDDGYGDWPGDTVVVPRLSAREARARSSQALVGLALVRALPGVLHGAIFDATRSAIVPSSAGDPRIAPFDAMLEDETAEAPGGRYVYVHMLIPHAPYTLDARCRTSAAATYTTQAACGLTLVARFLARLQALGRYESSLVLVHADHGWFDERWPALLTVDAATGDPVSRPLEARPAADWDNDPRRTDAYSNALMLLKPAGRGGAPMTRDLRVVELIDIPNTMLSALGLPADAPDGVSMLDPHPDAARVARTRTGVRHFDASGTHMVFAGRDYFEGMLAEHHWTPARGWFETIEVPFHWVEPEEQRCAVLQAADAAPLASFDVTRPQPDVLALSWVPTPGASTSNDAEVLASTHGMAAPLETMGRVPFGSGTYRIGDVSAVSDYRVAVRACAGSCCSPAREVVSVAGVPGR